MSTFHARPNGAVVGMEDDERESQLSGDTDHIVEQLLREVETSQSSFPTVFRKLVEQSSDSTSSQVLIDKLQSACSSQSIKYGEDINDICKRKYMEFGSVSKDLSSVKADVSHLIMDMKALNEDIAKSNQLVQSQTQVVEALRNEQSNALAAIENIQAWIPIIECFIKLQKQQSRGQLHHAVKEIDNLEKNLLPTLADNIMKERILLHLPKLQETVISQSRNQLTEFLTKIRDISPTIGEKAMLTTFLAKHKGLFTPANLRNKEETATNDVQYVIHSKALISKVNESIVETSGRPDTFSGDPLDGIDFSSLYSVCYIFALLNRQDELCAKYRDQRIAQCSQCLNMDDVLVATDHADFIPSIVKYFNRLAGFFIIEEYILATTGENTLGSKTFLERLWNDRLLKELDRKLTIIYKSGVGRSNVDGPPSARRNAAAQSVMTPRTMLGVNKCVKHFCLTMSQYGYADKPLRELLTRHQHDFFRAIHHEYEGQLRLGLGFHENHAPIVVDTSADYLATLETIPWRGRMVSLANVSGDPDTSHGHPVMITSENVSQEWLYPLQFPFSTSVPKLFRLFTRFVIDALSYLSDAAQTATDLDRSLRECTTVFFSTVVKPTLCTMVQSASGVQLEVAIQTVVDMYCVCQCLPQLDRFIAQRTNVRDAAVASDAAIVGTSNLGQKALQEVVFFAQKRLNKMISAKIATLVELAQDEVINVDTQSGGTGANRNASHYMTSLIEYLTGSNVQVILKLPPNLAVQCVARFCKELNSQLIEMLKQADVKHLSQGVFAQLNIDTLNFQLSISQNKRLLQLLDDIIDQKEHDDIEGLNVQAKDGFFAGHLTELEQLIELMTSTPVEWDDYMQMISQQTAGVVARPGVDEPPRFHLVKLADALAIADKCHNRRFTGKTERDRAFAKIAGQLRDLEQQRGRQHTNIAGNGNRAASPAPAQGGGLAPPRPTSGHSRTPSFGSMFKSGGRNSPKPK